MGYYIEEEFMTTNLKKTILPIMRSEENEDGELKAVYEGSGILFKNSDSYFILTVAHIFDSIDHELGFYIPMGKELINIQGILFKDSNFDIAIFKIDNQDLNKFENFIFLNEEDICYYPKEPYCIAGYPSSKIDFIPMTSELKSIFLQIKVNQNNEKAIKGQENLTLFLKYPSNWDELKVPHPQGLSGSGVWVKSSGQYKLTGINRFFNGTDCIFANRIHIYMNILNKKLGSGINVPRDKKD